MDVRICHVNIRSYRANALELLRLLDERDIHVVSLNETWLGSDEPFDPSLTPVGYQVFRKDRNRHGGGVALFIRQGIPAVVWDLGILSVGTEAIACLARIGGEDIVFASVYCRPGYHIDMNILEHLALHKRLIVLGDFNAKSRVLRCVGQNAQGDSLWDAIERANLALKSEGLPTHVHASGEDQLDLVLVSQKLVDLTGPVQVLEHIGSDHMPILVEVELGWRPEARKSVSWYNLRKADWVRYQRELNARLGEHGSRVHFTSPADIEEENRIVVEAILSAADLSVPKTSRKEIKTWSMTKELHQVIRTRNFFRRIWRTTRNPEYKTIFNRLAARRNELIAIQKQYSYERLCRNMEHQYKVASREFWAKFKSLSRGDRGGDRNITALKVNNRLVTDDAEKASLFASKLEAESKFVEEPYFDEGWRTRVEAKVAMHPELFSPRFEVDAGDDPIDPCDAVTALDIKAVATRLPTKAPGPDGVLNAFLRFGTDVLFRRLENLYMASLRHGYVPSAWKAAKVVMVPKPGKSPNDLKSYRPISLLSCVGKLLEKILAARLNRRAEDCGLTPIHQSGFRSARCTDDHTVRLAQQVAMAKSLGRSVVTALVDIEGAFPAVWHDGLRAKLCRSGISDTQLRWLSSFLSGRKFFVQVGAARSSWYEMFQGLPQGSGLSPELFKWFTADIPAPQGLEATYTSLGTFADDIEISASSTQLYKAGQYVQRLLTRIEEYCNRWRLKLAPSKCQVIIFQGHREGVLKTPIRVRGMALPVASEAKFLGVTFDSKLSWRPHFDRIRDQCMRRLNGMRALAGRGGLNGKVLMTVYKSFVRSVMEYGCAAFVNATNSQLYKLQRVQNAACRIALRANRFTSVTRLHEMAELPMLRTHLELRTMQFLNRGMSSNRILGDLIDNVRCNRERYQRTPVATILERLPEGPTNRPEETRVDLSKAKYSEGSGKRKFADLWL